MIAALLRLAYESHVLGYIPGMMNTIVSNVPGPPMDLYMSGARLTGIYSASVLLDQMGLNITLYTFGDRVDFGIHVDPDLIGDPWAIARAIPRALEEMMRTAGLGQPAPVEDPFGMPAEPGVIEPVEHVARAPERRNARRRETELPAGALRDPAFLHRSGHCSSGTSHGSDRRYAASNALPEHGPFLVVGNHSGGETPPDIPVLLTAWWRERGETEPIYALFHSFFLGCPVSARSWRKRARSRLDQPRPKRCCAPAGFFSTTRAATMKCSGPGATATASTSATGSASSASRCVRKCRCVPAVSVGAHETLVVLTRGEQLARLLHYDKLFRVKVMPFVLGPPFGIVPGGIPTFPLPAKITVEFLAPIDWSARYGPETAADDKVVRACFDEITRPCRRRSISSPPSADSRSSGDQHPGPKQHPTIHPLHAEGIHRAHEHGPAASYSVDRVGPG